MIQVIKLSESQKWKIVTFKFTVYSVGIGKIDIVTRGRDNENRNNVGWAKNLLMLS